MGIEHLYFIAIIPEKKICDEIEVFKLDFADHFESRAALKVVPHITLKAPFKLPAAEHDNLLRWFGGLFFNSGPFEIALKNFGAFHNKISPVVYVHPIMNVPLFSLQKEIIRSFRISYPQSGVSALELKFAPHITVAYRDLKPERFLEAWKIYQTKRYQTSFDVDSFHLLQHDRKKWNIIQTYDLQ
ncbi:MAG TPA: 2'-5' RNA ligase family protein [Puia sp.]|nr:2'-5' RNA ligase family protein [Puia sp.]